MQREAAYSSTTRDAESVREVQDSRASGTHAARWPLRLVRAWLERPRTPSLIIAVGLLLCAGALPTQQVLDDSFHDVALSEEPVSVGSREPVWNLFAFAKDPVAVAKFMDQGVFPWWSDVEGGFSFFRPLASLSLWLDHELWPHSMPLKHVHSLLWYGALCWVVLMLYRRFGPGASFASLALAVYAWDDARAMTVGWVANRSALMGLTFGFLALLAHDAFRKSGRPRALLAALGAIGGGLLCAETTLQALGYFVAYALFLDHGKLRHRLLALSPYAILVIVWRVLYVGFGYGAARTDLYIDAGVDPLRFLLLMLERMPLLLSAQFFGVFADLSDLLKYVEPAAADSVFPACVAALTLLGWLLWPLLRARADARFWASGMVMATVPVCAVNAADRLLTATGLGGAALLAIFLHAAFERTGPTRGRLGVVAAALLVLVNLVVAPVLLPVRAYALSYLHWYIAHAEESFPEGPEVAEKTIIVLNPPSDEFGIYVPFYRQARGGVMPERFRWLANADSELRVTRVDRHSLRVRPKRGFLPPGSLWTVRSREKRSFVGETIDLTGVRFQVTEVTSDGRPREVLVRFDHPLDSDRYVWLQWDTFDYKPFAPPEVGGTLTVPRADFKTLFTKPGSEPSKARPSR